MGMRAALLLACALAAACRADEPAPAPAETSRAPTGSGASPGREAEPTPSAPESPPDAMPQGAARPRWSPDGTRIAFHAGEPGARGIYVMKADGTEIRPVARMKGESRDPTWMPDGKRLVFSNDAEGDFDLYLASLDGGAPERLTSLPGDELEPTVASTRFAFYGVYEDECARGATGIQFDEYQKVVFTRRHGVPAVEEIWFSSIHPVDTEDFGDRASDFGAQGFVSELARHGAHQGLVSPQGKRCRSPEFSGDGLRLTWTCDDGPVVFDAPASWDASFDTAFAAVKGRVPSVCDEASSAYDGARCFEKLPRRYAQYRGKAASKAGDGVERSAFSANHILLVGDAKGRPVHREREKRGAAWEPFAIEGIRDARNVTWSPDGTRIAFDAETDGGRTIVVAPTDFYLQEVRNLHQFPELYQKGRSKKLQEQRFVARQGEQKEFYALHESLRYQRRPQFVTADAALQVFRDEFLRILRDAEKRASKDLLALTKALTEQYAGRLGASETPSDRYLATLFGTAYAALGASAALPEIDSDDLFMMRVDPDDEGSKALRAELDRPIEARLEGTLDGVLRALAEARLRRDVEANLRAMLAHEGASDLPVPGRARPARIPWDTFKIRGPYEDGAIAGYFLAMTWLAQAPLPVDASLPELVGRMQSLRLGDKSAFETWRAIDAFVGSFMGRPVDATLEHVRSLKDASPELFRPFDAKAVEKRLEALRGPMPIRDLEAFEQGEEGRALSVTFFPKRLGVDVTFFRALTHPDVPLRGMPSALDTMAALGHERAKRHALATQERTMRAAYEKALKELRAESGAPGKGFFGTDIYHAWFAVLAALAEGHDLPSDSLLTFARSDAWKDRLLSSSLAGYVQLKHAAVLYAMQDVSAECAGDVRFTVFVEQPVLPRPHGFVDPLPRFFESLSRLAERVYREMHDDPEGPTAPYFFRELEEAAYSDDGEEEPRLNAARFAQDLAEIAKREVEGLPLLPDHHRIIEYIGARLEALTLDEIPGQQTIAIGGDERAERGVAIVTDIHTNAQRGEALTIAIGRLLDLYVAVPDVVGQTMTQGGLLSFYELTHPMNDRLTDAEWAERVEKKQTPPLPAWTSSFVEGTKR